tara:strand:- start:101 stop:718 length:618 start_codon:yes stop_codon:yes gene_type:complete
MPSTYSDLKSDIIDYLNNMSAEQSVDTFINLVEAEMSRTVRHWRMEKRSTADLTTQYSALPSDFYEPVRLSLTSGSTFRLELVSQSEMMDLRQRGDNIARRPRYYAMTDGSIEVFPTPDSTYTLEMVYYSKIVPLSADNTSNWLLEYFPDAYLYGALMHSAPFLGEDNRLAVWSTLYGNAISAINVDSDKAKFGGSGHRMKIRSF